MAKFIIEIVHPLRFLREYKTFDSAQVSIGRGFNNDLILGDPNVSAAHLVVRSLEQGGWLVEDLSHENGMYVQKLSKLQSQAHLNSGDEIIIGRTRLRFFSPEHQVAATKLLVKVHPFFRKIGNPVNAISIFIICATVFIYHTYMSSTEETSILKLISGSLGFLFTALLWAGAWAFIGRMIKHKAQFAAQLSLSLLFLVVGLIFANISEYAGYAFNSMVVEMVLAAISLGGLGTAFLIGNITLAANVSLKNRVVVCSSIFLVILAIIALLYYSFKDEFNPNPVYFSTLKPPFNKILPPSGKSIDAFLDKRDIFTLQPVRQ